MIDDLRQELIEKLATKTDIIHERIEEVSDEITGNMAAIESLIDSKIADTGNVLKHRKRDFSDLVIQIKNINKKV